MAASTNPDRDDLLAVEKDGVWTVTSRLRPALEGTGRTREEVEQSFFEELQTISEYLAELGA